MSINRRPGLTPRGNRRSSRQGNQPPYGRANFNGSGVMDVGTPANTTGDCPPGMTRCAHDELCYWLIGNCHANL